MKHLFLIGCLLIFLSSTAQNKDVAEALVNKGIIAHDKGQYDKALELYKQALEQDKDNFNALAESAMTLVSLQRYNESIEYCKKAIQIHPGEKNLKMVYVTMGNAIDMGGDKQGALDIYDKGLKEFPGFYYLHYNKGITLTGLKKWDESILSFQQSAVNNPNHASTHNALGIVMGIQNQRIPAILAIIRFMSIESATGRSKANLQKLKDLLAKNVSKTGEKNITISISAESLSDKGNKQENNFSDTELILSMATTLDFDEKNKSKWPVELFEDKISTICASLKQGKASNHGFFWEYYAPFLIEMYDKDFVKTFSYLAHSKTGDSEVDQWLQNHSKEVEEFIDWAKSFKFI